MRGGQSLKSAQQGISYATCVVQKLLCFCIARIFNRRGAKGRKDVFEFSLRSSFVSLRFEFFTAEAERDAKMFFEFFLRSCFASLWCDFLTEEAQKNFMSPIPITSHLSTNAYIFLITNSVLRFIALPSSVLLSPTGFDSP
jgi:hypothetical protein